MKYQPINPIAEYVDKYGDKKVIHCPKGRAMRVFKGEGTALIKLNRATAVLLGEAIRKRRLSLGMSMEELGIKAGLKSATPKQYVYSIEKASRQEGMRLGTLLMISSALGVEPGHLLPSVADAMELAGVSECSVVTIR